MADDFVLNVKQISQYPDAFSAAPGDFLLLQKQGVGGPYNRLDPGTLLSTALLTGGWLRLAPGSGLAWNGASLSWNGGIFTFSENLSVNGTISAAGDVFANGEALASRIDVDDAFSNLIAAGLVTNFNGRVGGIVLQESDILSAGGILQNNPHFSGVVLAPTLWDARTRNDQVATTAFVHLAICDVLEKAHDIGALVFSFNGRGGDVILSSDDITAALTVPGAIAYANSPALGDASGRIATTLFVDESLQDLKDFIEGQISGAVAGQYAPIASPQFTGVPTAPTANPGSSTGQLATTAFVQAAVTAGTAGVSSFNTRTGAVVLTAGDVTAVGGAPLASPVFTGTPQGPTAAPGTNTTELATTAFVTAAIAALPTVTGVSSFNTRTGAVVLNTGDITGAGGAPSNNANLTGTPLVPTAAPGTSTAQAASTAFVAAAVAAVGAAVTSFNGRTGAVSLQAADVSAVGGAPVNSPSFTGTPAGPTAAPGNSSTQLATTAFVAAAIAAGVAGVSSWNGRSGAVTLTAGDVTGVGAALLASPAFSGTPTAPTAVGTSNDTTLATTAFVKTAIAGIATGVTTFNARTGAVTLQAADVSGVGGAMVASPSFTGTPAGPTAAPGTSTTQLATCAFVAAAIAALATGVTTFNGRAGAVTLSLADVTGAGGAPLASPSFTGTPAVPTATAGTNTTQAASTAFVEAAVAGVAAGAVHYSVSTFFVAGAANYTTPADSTTATVYRIRMVAGGGGGGGQGSSAANWGAAAGGAGEYKELIQTGIAPNTAWPITVGAAGTAGGSSGTSGTAGGPGGATSVTIGGQTIACNGGGGGLSGGAANNTGGAGGSGGATPALAGLTLIMDLPGQSGAAGGGQPTAPGPGTPLGYGGVTAGATATTYARPLAAVGSGGGGGGAFATTTQGNVGGGGAVIIERIAG